jgi:zinc/manganese transport system substrate-binding protein
VRFRRPAVLAAALLLAGAALAAPLRVYTTTTDLADVARRVGGDRVEVESLARGYQDPHSVEAKPSLIAKLMKADLYIQSGLDLEAGWAPLLLRGSRNKTIQPGARGFLDASAAVEPLDVPAQVSRALGDIHPYGNPHYMIDPENAKRVAGLIAERLAELSPADAARFQENARTFAAQVDDRMRRWSDRLEPYRGARFVSYHRNLPYLARRFGLVSAGEMEPKPGIPPTASHTAKLIARMKEDKVRLILTQPWYEKRTANSIARATGARVVVTAFYPESVPQAEDYLRMMDYNVAALAAALAGDAP